MKFWARLLAVASLCSLPVWADKTVYYRHSEWNTRRNLVGYYAIEDQVASASKEGVYRYTLGDDGRPKDVAYLVEGRPGKSPDGFYHIGIDYQAESWKITYFGESDQVLGRYLFLYGSTTKGGPPNILIMARGPDDLKPFPVDTQGRVVSEPETAKDGHALRKTYRFDAHDMIAEIRYVDDKDVPTVREYGGWSIQRLVRDEFNNIVDARYFDVNDRPMEFRGVHHSTFKFDAAGVKVEVHNYKLDGSEARD